MKENIDLARKREFGDIISDTFVLFRENFKPLLKSILVICGLFLLTDILISVFIAANHEDPSVLTLIGLFRVGWSFLYAILLLLTIQSYFVLYKEQGNQPPQLVQVWGYVRYYFFRVFFTEVVLTIVLAIGFFLCFLPFVYLAVVFSLILPIMTNENGNLSYSFGKAFKLIKEHWWFTFGVLLLICIVTFIMVFVLAIPVLVVLGGGEWLTGRGLGITSSIFMAIDLNFCKLLWIIPNIAVILTYHTLMEEKEAVSLADRINMFGKSKPGPDPLSTEQY
jgi:hypothetical protein